MPKPARQAEAGFDLSGAADDLHERNQRLAMRLGKGREAIDPALGLLLRNPGAAPAALAAIAAWCQAHPEQAQPLSAPLYPQQA